MKVIKNKDLNGIAITHGVEEYLFSQDLTFHIPLTKSTLLEFSQRCSLNVT